MTNYAPTSGDVNTLALYGPSEGHELGPTVDYYKPLYHTSMVLGPRSLGPGRYYVLVYTVKGQSKTQLYRLTVTY